MNWFLVATFVLYVGGAGWEFYRHDYAVGFALIGWGFLWQPGARMEVTWNY